MSKNMVRKELPSDVRDLGEDTLEFVVSTEEQDRDGEVVKASGWVLENFKKNPVVILAHMIMSDPTESIVGRAPEVAVVAGKLVAPIQFARKESPKADIAYRLAKAGYLNAVSVGFLPLEPPEVGDGRKAPLVTWTKQELVEISLVSVPANPAALRKAVEKGVVTTEEAQGLGLAESGQDQEMAQLKARVAELAAEVKQTNVRLAHLQAASQEPGGERTKLADPGYLREILLDRPEGGDIDPHAAPQAASGAEVRQALNGLLA